MNSNKIRIFYKNWSWWVESDSGPICYTTLYKAYEKALEVYTYRNKYY